MDSNELMKELYDTLKASGWYDKATSYFKENKEKNKESIIRGNKIANISIYIKYKKEKLTAI